MDFLFSNRYRWTDSFKETERSLQCSSLILPYWAPCVTAAAADPGGDVGKTHSADGDASEQFRMLPVTHTCSCVSLCHHQHNQDTELPHHRELLVLLLTATPSPWSFPRAWWPLLCSRTPECCHFKCHMSRTIQFVELFEMTFFHSA